jgi:fatty acid synthase, animal type
MCHVPLLSPAGAPKRNQMSADVLGLSLRFPESKSPTAFWDNLMNRVDMQTSDDRRWPRGLHNTPPRTGKAPDLDLFDNAFFSIHGKQAQKMDPQLRKLLEVKPFFY